MPNENLYRRIFGETSLGIALCEFIFDQEGNPIDFRFLIINPAFEKHVQLESKYIVGKTVKEIYPNIEQYWIDRYKPVILNLESIQFSDYNHNTDKYFSVNAFSASENKFVMVFTDVSNEKRAVAELKKSEQDYQNIFNSMLDMFQVIELIYDEDGNAIDYYYLQVNPAFEKLVNKKKSELIGKRAKDIFGIVEDYWIKTYEKIEKTGIPEVFENFGAELNKYYIINAWKADEKQVAIVFKDITVQKLQEKELIKAKEKAEESDRLKLAFLTNMSHEIRTPMNGILGFADLLKNHNLSGDEQKKYIQIIEKSGTRLLNIINDIVHISKIEAGLMEVNLSPSNINEQLEFIYNFFKPEVESKGMQFLFKNSLPASKALVTTDKEKLFAILTNLVKNAIKYSEKGTIELGYNVKNEFLEIYVKDSGIGIHQDRQQAIFERFVQVDRSDNTAIQGAGLGLSISKAFVEMLGGQIWVESKKGSGSTFYFTIPYEVQQQVAINDNNITTESKIQKLKVLVVEDDEVSAMLLCIILKSIDSEFIHAKDGKAAIELYGNHPDIDLILMDINLPEMDGYEATRQIRQLNKDVIIIAQTGHGFIDDKTKAIEAGCNEHLSKPVTKKELLSLIQQYFVK